MSFYILLNQISTLFLSMGILTTMTFDSEVTNYLYGGTKSDLFIQVTNNMKTLAIKPKKMDISSNLLVITKDRKYYFNIRYDQVTPHNFVEVKNGEINHSLKSLVKRQDYEILEGKSSLLFINRSNRKIKVNDIEISKKGYLSKGVPIIKDGKRILN